MKGKIILIIFCFSSFILHAQNKTYKIVYRHCLQLDTSRTLPDTLGTEATLIGNGLVSNYQFAKMSDSLKKLVLASESKMNLTDINKVMAEKQSGQVALKAGISFDSIGNMVFWNKKTDSVFVREKMITQYVVTREKMPEIKWVITNDIKKISDYNCVKAITSFRGRNYTAWFTSDLPIVEGPWKFKGLPGLLLSISDDDNQVKIYATKIEYPSSEQVPVFKQLGKEITLADYFNFYNEEQNLQTQKIFSAFTSQPEVQGNTQATINPRIRKRAYYKIEKRF